MEKKFNNNLNPEQEAYIKEKLYEKYKDSFEKYGMDSISQAEICNMAEFLITMHPEKYAKSMGTENNYRSDKNLQKIYAVVDKQKNTAVLINTNENGKVPEGEFGVYDLQKNQFKASNEVKKELVEYLGIGALEVKTQDEIMDSIFKDLKDMDKLATMDLSKVIEERRTEIDEIIDQKIDEANEKNGKTTEERAKLEKDSKEEQVTVGQEKDGQTGENQKLPEDVVKACKRLGITNIRSYFYVKATELNTKIEGSRVNPAAGNVLMIETNDSSRGMGPNRYYGIQNEKLCIYGNKDEEVSQVASRITKNSKNGIVVKPLDIEEKAQYVEYTDSQGLVIKEKLEENMNLSVEDLEAYKKKIEAELEKFSEELYKIEGTPFLNDAQKDELYIKANERFNTSNEDLAEKYNIDLSDVKEINLATDERTQDQVDKEVDKEDDDYIPGRRYPGM